MSVACPGGHASETTDYCDQCGAPLTASAAPPCPACAAPRAGPTRFCESCGYDFEAARGRAAAWEAVIEADRAHFERVAADGLSFPETAASRVVALDRDELCIGRGTKCDIDLSDDPAVSHAHAKLVRRDDGAYVVLDLDSTNGTTVNDGEDPVAPGTQVPLADGDRIAVGAWTTITIRAARAP